MEDSAGAGIAADAAVTPAVSSAAQQEAAAKEEQPAGGATTASAQKAATKLTGKLREPDPSSEDDYEGNLRKNKAAAKKPLRCQVDGCGADLAQARKYFQRYRVCERHLKAPSLQMDGHSVRFCDQCSKFHDITMFEGSRRTCNEKLERTRQARSDKRRQLTEQAMRAQGRLRNRMYDVSGMKRPFDDSYEYDDNDDEDYELEAQGYLGAKRNRVLPPVPPAAMQLAAAAQLMGPLQDHLDAQGILALHRAALAAAAAGGINGGMPGCPPIPILLHGHHGPGHPNDGGASSLSSWDDGHPQVQLLRMDSISSRPGAMAAGLAAAAEGHCLLAGGGAAAAGLEPLLRQAPRVGGAGGALSRRALALSLSQQGMTHDAAAALLAELYGLGDGQATVGLIGPDGGIPASKLLAMDPRVGAGRGGLHAVDVLPPVIVDGGVGAGGVPLSVRTSAAERADLALLEERLLQRAAAAEAVGGGLGVGVSGLTQLRMDEGPGISGRHGLAGGLRGGPPGAGAGDVSGRAALLQQLHLAAATEAAQAAGGRSVGIGGGGSSGGGAGNLSALAAAQLGGAAQLLRGDGTGARLTAAEEELYKAIVGGGGGTGAAAGGPGLDDRLQDTGVGARAVRQTGAAANGYGAARLLGGASAATAARDAERQQAQEDAVAAAELLLARLGAGGRGLGAAVAALRGAAAAAGGDPAEAGPGSGTARVMPTGRSMPVLNLADDDPPVQLVHSAAALPPGRGNDAGDDMWPVRRVQHAAGAAGSGSAAPPVQLRGQPGRQPPLASLSPPRRQQHQYDEEDNGNIDDARLDLVTERLLAAAAAAGLGRGAERPRQGHKQLEQLSELQEQLQLQLMALKGRSAHGRDLQGHAALPADRPVRGSSGHYYPENLDPPSEPQSQSQNLWSRDCGTGDDLGQGGLSRGGAHGRQQQVNGGPQGSSWMDREVAPHQQDGDQQFVHLRHLQEQLHRLGVQVVLQ